jgi:hypothetical protein
MKLAAIVARSLRTDMQAELREVERAVATGTRETGRGLRTELRRQVTGSGLGQRLANSWRDKHYPNQQIDAASLIYTKAPQIIRAFDEGAMIRSKRGRFLAILPRTRRGREPMAGGSARAPSPSTASGRSGSCLDPADRRSWSSMACEPRSVARAGSYEASSAPPIGSEHGEMVWPRW